jgi:hypothetical protein
LPEDFTLVSHRRLVGTASPVSREQYLATRGSLEDLGLRGELRFDHLLGISPRAAFGVVTWYGTVDGGEFEDSFAAVLAHDSRRVHGFEFFDLDQVDAALARYHELSDLPAAAPSLSNAAVRSAEDATPAPQGMEVLATRGERLALVRYGVEGGDGSLAPDEGERLAVIEVDDRGDRSATVMFDAGNLEGAFAELNDRYDAGEAASHRRAKITRAFSHAFATRDWDTLATLLAPDLVVNDHRIMGWEPLRGPEPYLQAIRSLVELAPDVQLRVDHVRMADPVYLYVTTWVGTREGGAFEAPSVIACELDDLGRIRRIDQYDLAQLPEAQAALSRSARNS